MKKIFFILSAIALLTACDQESKQASKPAPPSVQATLVPETPPTDKWVGKWIGVEGLHLTIAKDDSIGRGHYVLTMQYGLDATTRAPSRVKRPKTASPSRARTARNCCAPAMAKRPG